MTGARGDHGTSRAIAPGPEGVPPMLPIPFRSARHLASPGAAQAHRLPRAPRPPPRAGGALQPAHQCHRGPRRGARARARPAGGSGPRPGGSPRSAARRADDGEGILRRRGSAEQLGAAGHEEQHGRAPCAVGASPDGRRRGGVRQDQRAGDARRLAELQPGLRHDQQSVGRDACSGRLIGWRGGGARGRSDRSRNRQRYRRLDPQPCALLRFVRPQADVRRRLAPGPGPARGGLGDRHLGDSDRSRAAPTTSRWSSIRSPAPMR
jgi:hypothetical protein